MRLSYTAVWDDAAAMLRANASLIAALAGAFLFLPALVVRQYAAPPSSQGAPADFVHVFAAFQAYVAAYWPLLLAARIAELVGSVAILELVLGPRGTSVAGAIGTGFLLLPFYFATFFLANIAIFAGIVLLVVPGLYLLGRLAPFPAVVVAERRRSPFDALARAWALTAGRGWAVLGLLLLVMIAIAIVTAIAGMVLGVVFVFLAGKGLGGFLAAAAAAVAGAAGAVVMLALYAALYRHLAGGESGAALGAVFD